MREQYQYDLLDKANQLSESGKTGQAVRILRQLARLGNLHAQSNLGILLEDEIKPARPREAVYWYKRAARRGYWAAASNLAIHYRDLGQFRWQLHWLKVAAKLGDSDAPKEIRKLERALARR